MATLRTGVFKSSVGTKLLIGATGLFLFIYLIIHIGGNLMVFLGPEVFNEYSHTLISNPLVLPIELGLLAVFLIHIYKGIRMWTANRAARPVAYLKKARVSGTIGNRTPGPAFYRLGRRAVRYKPADLDAWLATHRVAQRA